MGVQWDHIVVLTCISLMTRWWASFVCYLWRNPYSSPLPTLCGLQDLSSPTRDRTRAPAVKAPSANHWTTREFPFARFKIGLFVLFWSCKRSFYTLNTSSLSDMWSCKCFLPVYGLSLHLTGGVIWLPKVLNFDNVQFIHFFFCRLCFRSPVKETTA